MHKHPEISHSLGERLLPVAKRMYRSSRPGQGFVSPLRALDLGSELRVTKPTGDGQRDASGGGSELGIESGFSEFLNHFQPTTNAGSPTFFVVFLFIVRNNFLVSSQKNKERR